MCGRQRVFASVWSWHYVIFERAINRRIPSYQAPSATERMLLAATAKMQRSLSEKVSLYCVLCLRLRL